MGDVFRMKIAGIIAEYNPFHQGHAFHLRKARRLTRADYMVVLMSGNYVQRGAPAMFDKYTRAKAALLGGADLVLGNHPHVLQPRELYKDKEILYSLGNFCFGGNRKPENRTIIYQLILSIQDGVLAGTASEIIPCYVHTGGTVNNYCPAPITDEAQAQRVLDFLDGRITSPY